MGAARAARPHLVGPGRRTSTRLPRSHPRPEDGPVVVVDGADYVPQPDPFEPFSTLLDLDPLQLGGEGPLLPVARESGDGWRAAVRAVEVGTDHGRILLEADSTVDVRTGHHINEKRSEQLQPGDILLVGRTEGRVGLLEAVEERLRTTRSDLFAARYLVEDYRRRVAARFAKSGLTVAALHRDMAARGCQRTVGAVRSWVRDGHLAPQHCDDLAHLAAVLQLDLTDIHLGELFASVQRLRGFRRAAGRALAAAGRAATTSAVSDTDPTTGLSIADLRDVVIEAAVQTVQLCEDLIPFTLLGHLELR